MKRYFIHIPGCFLIMILFSACASSRPMPLPADFWNRERLNIGVVLGKASEPKVKTGPSIFGHPLPYGEMLTGGDAGYDEGGEFSDQGGMQSKYGVQGEQLEKLQYGSSEKGYPKPPSETGTLEENLHAMGAGLLMSVQEHFVKRLAHTGWHVVPLQGSIGDDYHHADGLQGYDALIIIDCDWYGVHCRTKAGSRTPTFVRADMHARMIDLKSDRVLWQSPRKKAGNPVSCPCDDPGCFPVVRSALQKSVNRAGNALLADLFMNRP